jgi:hypothetical protein
MAHEMPGTRVGTQKAGADLSALQYRFVKRNAAGDVISASVLGERTFGILENKPKSGEAATVHVGMGLMKVVASAAIAMDAPVTTAADGRAVTAGAGHHIHGRAMIAAGAAGEITTFLHRYEGVA